MFILEDIDDLLSIIKVTEIVRENLNIHVKFCYIAVKSILSNKRHV